MPVTFEESEARSVVCLEGEVKIPSAAELKDLLLHAFTLPGELVVSLAGATEIDLTALQLVWAAEREAGRSGKRFTLELPLSGAVAATLAGAGLSLREGVQ